MSRWRVPVMIFCIKVVEYLLTTAQTLAVVRGQGELAAGLALTDTVIWLCTLSYTIHTKDWRSFLAYAAGAGIGTYLGVRGPL